MSQARTIATNFLVFLGAIIACACVCEAVVRLAYTKEERRSIATIFDPTNFWVGLQDRAHHWFFKLPTTIHADSVIEINGERFSGEPAPNTLRVLFLGDSGTIGYGVERDQAFPARFQAHAMDRGVMTPIEVINAGVYGMTTVDEYDLLLRLLPLRPDIVVVGVFMGNDIGFNLAAHRKRLVAGTSGFLGSAVQAIENRSAFAQLLLARYFTLNTLRSSLPTVDTVVARAIPEAGLLGSDGLNMLSYPENEVATYREPRSELVEESYLVMESALRHMEEACRSIGAELRVVLIPSASAISKEIQFFNYPAEETRLRQQLSEAKLNFDAPYERMTAISRRVSKAVINPLPKLRAFRVTDLILPNDDHPTPLGHDLIGETIARDLFETATEPKLKEVLFGSSGGEKRWVAIMPPDSSVADVTDASEFFAEREVSTAGMRTGKIYSPYFTVPSGMLRIGVKGGSKKAFMNLWIGDQIKGTARGESREKVTNVWWFTAGEVGKEARIEIVDNGDGEEDEVTVLGLSALDLKE